MEKIYRVETLALRDEAEYKNFQRAQKEALSLLRQGRECVWIKRVSNTGHVMRVWRKTLADI